MNTYFMKTTAIVFAHGTVITEHSYVLVIIKPGSCTFPVFLILQLSRSSCSSLGGLMEINSELTLSTWVNMDDRHSFSRYQTSGLIVG